MRQALINFLQFKIQNFIPEVVFALIVIWAVLVICALFSVVSQWMAVGWKLLWIGFIVAVPLVGLLLYCAFCLTRVDYSFMAPFIFPGAGGRETRNPTAGNEAKLLK